MARSLNRSINPAQLLSDGFDWAGRTGQLGYLLSFVAVSAALAGWWYLETREFARWLILLALLPTSVLFFAFCGHQMRRLNDLGWTGWAWWLLLVPPVNLLLILLCMMIGGGRRFELGVVRNEPAMLVALVLSILLVWRSYAAPHVVLTAEMKPALMPGDVVIVRLGQRTPAYGDVMLVETGAAPRVFRVLGLPGDEVQLSDGLLAVNGVRVASAFVGQFDETLMRQGPDQILPRCENGAVAMGALCRKSILRETLINGRTVLTLNVGTQRSDDTDLIVVPEGHFFVLGDNRDVANDSRMSLAARGVGLVPQDAIRGRVSRVVISAPGAYVGAFWTWAWDRAWTAVE